VATPSDPGTDAAVRDAAPPTRRITPDELEAELRQAIEDIERGDYIELTDEQLARCIATGESPWPDASPG
jgi:hypothetical protein